MVLSESANSSLMRSYTTIYFLGHTLLKSIRSVTGTTESIKSGLMKKTFEEYQFGIGVTIIVADLPRQQIGSTHDHD